MSQAVIDSMSQQRFGTYLKAAGFNHDRAIALYKWNGLLGASFHIAIQAAEVVLRNRINSVLVGVFGQDWWKSTRFLNLADEGRKRDLETVKTRIQKRNIKLETDQIVAGLSFGFWVGMLGPSYNPALWSAHLRKAFPSLPSGETRDTLCVLTGKIAHFRNRITHHEPLLHSNASQIFTDLMKLLHWLCPDTERWLRPQCSVQQIIRQKP